MVVGTLGVPELASVARLSNADRPSVVCSRTIVALMICNTRFDKTLQVTKQSKASKTKRILMHRPHMQNVLEVRYFKTEMKAVGFEFSVLWVSVLLHPVISGFCSGVINC